ncbi:MAG TPA: hypothetical protein V6D03_11580, partial [Candidatus Caenarcaniphilales bacterium]
ETFKDEFTSARAGSSRVRNALGRMAVDRWWNEAPLWGHGIVETRGPRVVKFMPVGSHHAWFGLLFSKGLVGFITFAIPLLCSFIDLLSKAQKSRIARVGLSMILVLFIFTFAENIEYLAYIYWPGLVMLGISFKEKVSIPPKHALA